MSSYLVKTLSIPAGESISNTIDIDKRGLQAIVIPSSWTKAAISFQMAIEEGGDYVDVFFSTGEEVKFFPDASKAYVISPSVLEGLRFIKIRSGSSATPVIQVSTANIKLILGKNN